MQQTGKQSRAASDPDAHSPGCRQRRAQPPGALRASRMRCGSGIRWRGVMEWKERGPATVTSPEKNAALQLTSSVGQDQ